MPRKKQPTRITASEKEKPVEKPAVGHLKPDKEVKLEPLPQFKDTPEDKRKLRDFTSKVEPEDRKNHPWTGFEAPDKNGHKISLYRGKAAYMREKLKRQPMIRTYIPRPEGEDSSIPETINLNGYKLNIQKNTYCDLPLQIADIIRESHQQIENAFAAINAELGLDRMKEGGKVLDQLV